VCGPPTLLPPEPAALGVDFGYRPETMLPDVDVVMVLRLPRDRNLKNQFPSTAEYAKFWSLTQARAKMMRPGAIILHPGPIYRGVEMDPEVADGPQSLIYDQAWSGVLVRMAVLARITHPQGIEKWLQAY